MHEDHGNPLGIIGVEHVKRRSIDILIRMNESHEAIHESVTGWVKSNGSGKIGGQRFHFSAQPNTPLNRRVDQAKGRLVALEI